jgi:hypothetical protein
MKRTSGAATERDKQRTKESAPAEKVLKNELLRQILAGCSHG